jgi:hypothetical protein
MTTITFDAKKHTYNKETKVFRVSERDVKFDTTYSILNPRTNKEMKFEFTHSTGPEFDPETRWVYKGAEGITLEVCNDARMAQQAEQMYLDAKLQRGGVNIAPMPNLKGNPAYDLMM